MWSWTSKTREAEQIPLVAASLPIAWQRILERLAAGQGLRLVKEAPREGSYILVLEQDSPPPDGLSADIAILRVPDSELEQHMKQAVLFARALRGFRR